MDADIIKHMFYYEDGHRIHCKSNLLRVDHSQKIFTNPEYLEEDLKYAIQLQGPSMQSFSKKGSRDPRTNKSFRSLKGHSAPHAAQLTFFKEKCLHKLGAGLAPTSQTEQKPYNEEF